MRAAISVLGPTSIASVLRFAAIDSGENSAWTSFALPSASCCACARGDERRRLHREAERLRDAAQRIGLLVDQVLELVGRGRELLRDLLPLEVRLDLRLHFVERARRLRGVIPMSLIT